MEKVTCPKCGGEMALNLEKKLYMCEFCGVAFGMAFSPGKAQESLRKGSFSEADTLFTYILTLDPHNFLALRGRVFCAAKWPNAEAVKEMRGVIGMRLDAVQARCNEALSQAKEEDREYFGIIHDMLALNRKNLENEKWAKPLLKEKDRLKNGSADVLARIHDEEKELEKMRRNDPNDFSVLGEVLDLFTTAPARNDASRALDAARTSSEYMGEQIRHIDTRLEPYYKSREENRRKLALLSHDLLAMDLEKVYGEKEGKPS